MMTEALKGRRLEEADALFESFRGLVTGKNDGAGDAAGVGGVAGAAGTHSGAGERSARGTAETGEGSTDASGNRSAIRGTAGIRSADRGVGTAGTAVALGKLAVFSGVGEFPMRVKCATLAWHTLRAALEGKHEPVSTE
jgi:NifU-like protein involved in Fe-S cluster formation